MLTHPIDRFKLPAEAHYFSEKAAAELLGCSYKTLQAWRQRGAGPAWLRLGPRRVAYTLDDIQRWAASNRPSGGGCKTRLGLTKPALRALVRALFCPKA